MDPGRKNRNKKRLDGLVLEDELCEGITVDNTEYTEHNFNDWTDFEEKAENYELRNDCEDMCFFEDTSELSERHPGVNYEDVALVEKSANHHESPESLHENATDFRLLGYVNYIVAEGLSQSSAERLDNLMALLYGHEPPFNHSSAFSVIEQKSAKLESRVTYYCKTCGKTKPTKLFGCCEPYPKLIDTGTMVVPGFSYQLRNILMRKGQEILDCHKQIHFREEMFEISDSRRFDAYKTSMESREEWESGSVNLIVTVSSDGAVFKRLSRREAIPVLMRLEGLDHLSKHENLVVLSLTWLDGGIKPHSLSRFVEQSFRSMKNAVIRVHVGDRLIRFKIVVLSYICDMKEQKALTKLPNWFQEQGCAECMTQGTRKRNGKVSYASLEPAPLRTDDGTLWSARNSKNGFTDFEIPKIFDYFSPTTYCIDPFHVRSVGVCKDFVKEFLKPTRWNSLKINKGYAVKIEKALKSSKQYTYDTVKLMLPSQTSKCTGREVDKMSMYLSALCGYTEAFESPDWNAFCIGFFYSLVFLGGQLASPAALRTLLESLLTLHVGLEPDSITLKWHCFYHHLIDHELHFGPLHTTEWLERKHKDIMTSVNHQTTSCEKSLIERMIVGAEIRRDIDSILTQFNEKTRNLLMGSMKRRSTELRRADIQNTSNFVPFGNLDNEQKNLVEHAGISTKAIFSKRSRISTRLGTFTVAGELWKSNSTDQSTVLWMDPVRGSFHFGRILHIFSQNDTSFVLAVAFQTEPLMITLEPILRKCSAAAKAVIESCTCFPICFSKIIDESLTIFPLSSILSPASVISFDENRFVKMYR